MLYCDPNPDMPQARPWRDASVKSKLDSVHIVDTRTRMSCSFHLAHKKTGGAQKHHPHSDFANLKKIYFALLIILMPFALSSFSFPRMPFAAALSMT